MLESFAAGTPVIAYATGGMQEHISNGVTGMLVPEMTAEALAGAITDLYEKRYNFDSSAIKAYALKHFDPKRQSEQYLELYTKLQTQTEPYQPSI
jgi:glycosyltransferase involved in cell wall biosynthesis